MAIQGDLCDMSVADLIQYVGTEVRSACVVIESMCPARCASLFFDGGQLVHAELDGTEGEEVVLDVLRWREGSFIVDTGIAPRNRSISRQAISLLLEGADFGPEPDPIPPSETAAASDSFGPLVALTELAGVVGALWVTEEGLLLDHNLAGGADLMARRLWKLRTFLELEQVPVLRVLASEGLSEDCELLVLQEPPLYLGVVLRPGAGTPERMHEIRSVLGIAVAGSLPA